MTYWNRLFHRTPKPPQHPTPQAIPREPFKCLACLSTEFLEGPHGGLSVNFCCANCGARYNDCFMWIDIQMADGNERSWFGPAYRPRTAKTFAEWEQNER